MTGRSDWIEQVYCAQIYPYVKDSMAVVTSLLPISFAELILYGLILYAVWVVVGGLFRWIFRNIRFSGYITRLLSLTLFAAVLLNLFYVTWGFNYFRQPLAARMHLEITEHSEDQLANLVTDLSQQAAAVRGLVPEDDSGVFDLGDTLQSTLDALPGAYASLSEKQPVFAGRVTRAKQVLWSEGLSWAGISGIYVGFTAEPNINVHQPSLLVPQAAAHEMAHQLGIASENEAEFSAYLACMQSDSPAVRYSGLMQAFLVSGNALSKVAPDRYAAIRAACSDAMQRDLASYNAYWQQHEGTAEQTADAINDAYLKFNAQQSGIKSYGESVDLLLAWYDVNNAASADLLSSAVPNN